MAEILTLCLRLKFHENFNHLQQVEWDAVLDFEQHRALQQIHFYYVLSYGHSALFIPDTDYPLYLQIRCKKMVNDQDSGEVLRHNLQAQSQRSLN